MEKGAAAIEKLAEVQVERAQRQEIESSVERVVKAAKVTLARGSSRIQIQLDPPELGRLLVDIRRSATGIHLELHASTVKAHARVSPAEISKSARHISVSDDRESSVAYTSTRPVIGAWP
ncbi:MAG: hypothetical protein IIC08_01580 [Proteobacteria bacterium]|nr:hypothetical protein [Pseudomonadota bacterium]